MATDTDPRKDYSIVVRSRPPDDEIAQFPDDYDIRLWRETERLFDELSSLRSALSVEREATRREAEMVDRLAGWVRKFYPTAATSYLADQGQALSLDVAVLVAARSQPSAPRCDLSGPGWQCALPEGHEGIHKTESVDNYTCSPPASPSQIAAGERAIEAHTWALGKPVVCIECGAIHPEDLSAEERGARPGPTCCEEEQR